MPGWWHQRSLLLETPSGSWLIRKNHNVWGRRPTHWHYLWCKPNILTICHHAAIKLLLLSKVFPTTARTLFSPKSISRHFWSTASYRANGRLVLLDQLVLSRYFLFVSDQLYSNRKPLHLFYSNRKSLIVWESDVPVPLAVAWMKGRMPSDREGEQAGELLSI